MNSALQVCYRQRHKGSRNLVATIFMLALFSGCEQQTPNSTDPLSQALAPTGDWTFINYWAEWCAPCIREIPELNQLNLRDGYRVLGVNFDGELGEALAAQEQKLGIAFPTLPTDPGPRLAVSTPLVLPTTIVLDPQGDLVDVLVGPQTEASLVNATGNDLPSYREGEGEGEGEDKSIDKSERKKSASEEEAKGSAEMSR
ncbi:MAG: TlpA disulfide reductase family protein [Pseudomonadota bacterium]